LPLELSTTFRTIFWFCCYFHSWGCFSVLIGCTCMLPAGILLASQLSAALHHFLVAVATLLLLGLFQHAPACSFTVPACYLVQRIFLHLNFQQHFLAAANFDSWGCFVLLLWSSTILACSLQRNCWSYSSDRCFALTVFCFGR
jgi:hypothetical protein